MQLRGRVRRVWPTRGAAEVGVAEEGQVQG